MRTLFNIIGTAFRLFIQFCLYYLYAMVLELIVLFAIYCIFDINISPNIVFIGTAIVLLVLYFILLIKMISTGNYGEINQILDDYYESEVERRKEQNEFMMNQALKDYHAKRGRWFF